MMEARQRSQTPSSRPRPKKLETLKEITQGRAQRQRQREQQLRRYKTGAKCPSCNEQRFEEQDGVIYCGNCFTTIEESNIVNELTFEDGSGGPVLQGAYVGEGQTHARTMGTQYSRFGGGAESSDIALSLGRTEIRKQTTALHLPDHIADTAFSLYKLASINNFIQGRRVRNVAAACIYIACRRDKKNTTLLMDLSDLIQVNVFKLGQAYRDLKQTLVIDYHVESAAVPVLEVEHLIEKYARRMEFGNYTLKVAEDALKLVKRMKRDWMVTGRSPAGLCGACLILAARMNNFRRSVREVVFVVKAADPTITKRIEEFRRTTVSQLTVEQFRQKGLRWKDRADPPIYFYQQQKEEKQRKKLAQQQQRLQQQQPQTSTEAEVDPRLTSTRTTTPSSTEQLSQQAHDLSSSRPPTHRVDSEGFAVPQLPASVSADTSESQGAQENSSGDDAEGADSSPNKQGKRKAGSTPTEDDHAAKKRKRSNQKGKGARPPSIVITEDMLIGERELEAEMQGILNNPPTSLNINNPDDLVIEARARALADERRGSVASSGALDDEIIQEDEFDDDEEVMNCLLNEAEVKVKETIWVTHNEDWLRQQQAKEIARTLREEERANKKPRKRRKRGRLGDGSVLEGGEPVKDAADATRRMLEKRSKGFSKSIDYEKLEALYGGSATKTSSTVASSSVASSEAGSPPPPAQRERDLQAGAAVGAQTSTPRPTPRKPTRQPTRAGRTATTQNEADSTQEVEEQAVQTQEVAPPLAEDNTVEEDDDYDMDEDDDEDEEDEDDEAGRNALQGLGIDEDEYYGNEDDGYGGYDDDEEIGFAGYEDD